MQSNFLPVTQETVFSKIYQVIHEPKEIATVSFQKKKKNDPVLLVYLIQELKSQSGHGSIR